MRFWITGRIGILLAGLVVMTRPDVGRAAEFNPTQLQEIIDQNRKLQDQVRAQQVRIEDLNAKMAEMVTASERHERELRGLQERGDGPAVDAPASRSGSGDRVVRIAAEAGIAYFNTGSAGQFPKSEFRVDDPVITVEAPVLKNVYFFTELKLLPRETNVDSFQLGELYVDFENVSEAWGAPGLLSVRAGRLNIPFGEEYLRRSPMTNPLISHSLSDIWGVDEGVEIYGRVGPMQYVVAVQNGGMSRLHDYNADKSIAGRLSWQPARWLQVSGSAMRTGELATVADNLSELWIGNGFFRSIGPANRTGTFWANLVEADATMHWNGGRLSAALGQARYDDSDTAADNSRRFDYGHVEWVQTLTGGLYGAVRYSGISVKGGYPLAGWGAMGAFFFRPVFTEELRRTSVGLGYHFGPPVVVKVEYAWETGRTITGMARDKEDFFGTELGVKF